MDWTRVEIRIRVKSWSFKLSVELGLGWTCGISACYWYPTVCSLLIVASLGNLLKDIGRLAV